MMFADAATVHRALPYAALIEALREAHRGPAPDTAHIVRTEPGAGDRDGGGEGGENAFVALLGWQRGRAIAVKMVGVFPGNLALSPPQASVQGLVAAFDPGTGRPLLVADGEAMTHRKTAADSGLGARLLAREDAEVLLVVGAGGLAPHVMEAHLVARPSIRQVLVWNRTPERAAALAARSAHAGVAVDAVADLDAGVARADVISCVTMSAAPLVKGALLRPGAHLDLVGAYRADMREADDAAMVRGTLFVDTRANMEGAGDLAQPVAAGLLGWDAVRSDLYGLAQGLHPGRRSAEEVTVFKNVGGGHLDLFTAEALLRALGAGGARGA